MIPASFPLILVAVVCLAIGLFRGSSSLLIASIVASLLAAVALVIGARQNSAARRPESPDAPEYADRPDSFDESVPPGPAPRRTSGAPFAAHDSAPAGAASAADSGYAGESPYAADGSYAAESAESSAAAGRTDPIGFPAADQVYAERPAADHDAAADLPPTPGGASGARTHLTDETVVSPAAAADYQAASSTIGAARRDAVDDQARRRPAAAPSTSSVPTAPAADAAPAAPAAFSADAGPSASAAFPEPAAGPAGPARAPGQGPPAAEAGGQDSSLEDGFAEPDVDDPDDEPLPQAVRPTDAVQVARLDTEVLVVDGRPRYHMADCPHLVGRLTEPLPAAEAVELGFSPCGLCRPVDRLLGADARR
jgi:clumping factor A